MNSVRLLFASFLGSYLSIGFSLLFSFKLSDWFLFDILNLNTEETHKSSSVPMSRIFTLRISAVLKGSDKLLLLSLIDVDSLSNISSISILYDISFFGT